MGYVKWSYDTLNTFCHDVFRKFGFNEEETNIIKDVLLTADLYGIESHGMQRMVRYDKGIEKKIDELLAKEGMQTDDKTIWWEVVDFLFDKDYKHEAMLAQRHAVPLLSDSSTSAQDEKMSFRNSGNIYMLSHFT